MFVTMSVTQLRFSPKHDKCQDRMGPSGDNGKSHKNSPMNLGLGVRNHYPLIHGPIVLSVFVEI
jgi:hypothetical protein